MKREILITSGPRETRVAILEDDRLAELMVDRPDHRRIVGDIYLGRVEAVLPGLQAAFVDIGLEKSAFLHVSDLLEPDEDEEPSDKDDAEVPDADEAESAEAEDEIEVASNGKSRRGQRHAVAEPRQREVSGRGVLPDIGEILKKGQTLPVQVTKEPISTKGSRVTAQISLPGRFLVYMPYASRVGDRKSVV